MTTWTANGPDQGTGRVAARRAVEALRSGVPSRDAVAALGSGQPGIEERFGRLLDAEGALAPSRGLLIGGGFGAGKSHVLEHLAHLALEQEFAVSRVVVSKETPLHDPAKVLRTAVETAQLPTGALDAVGEAAIGLDPGSPAYAELLAWADTGPVDERFALTLRLLPRLQAGGDEFAETIVRFWSGDPIGVADLRRAAKQAGQPRPTLASVPARDLARQRIRFLARLFVATGFRGWVILFDEVELIGRYSPLQRGRSYAELAWWLHPDPEDRQSPLRPVLAITDDYAAALLDAKHDREGIPSKLRGKLSPAYAELAGQAEAGMAVLERQVVQLSPPRPEDLDRVYAKLRTLHGQAFGWEPPDVAGLERLGTTRMRQYVRAWINEWDLRRLDPDFQPETEVVPMAPRWDEDQALGSQEEGTGGEEEGAGGEDEAARDEARDDW